MELLRDWGLGGGEGGGGGLDWVGGGWEVVSEARSFYWVVV